MVALGASLGRYRLAGRIGAGGMGEVFLAHDRQTGRAVAVKRLAALAGHAEQVARLREEARIQARLFHPSLAALLELIETAHGPCLVMEHVGGPTLREWAARQPAHAWREKLALAGAIARGVAYLHARGVIHRDITPDNVRLARDGTPKLLDFGIARDGSGPGLTRAGHLVGTLPYMAPEQLEGGPASPRSDVWALGVLLHELLTGRLPFRATSAAGIAGRIRAARRVPAGRLVDGLPPQVDALLARCLQPRPDRRPADAGLVAVAIDALLRGSGGPRPAGTRLGPRDRPRPAWLVPAFVSALALACAARGVQLLQGGPPATLAALALDEPQAAAAAASRLVVVEGLGHRYEVYRDGQRLGETPVRFEAMPGSRIALECRRDGRTVDAFPFTVGMRNHYPCRN
jgi:serine/threonine protein kinase